MRIGIDLYDLKPNMKQGINVYSESLVNGFLNLKEKFTLQLCVNKDYLKYARSKFKSAVTFYWVREINRIQKIKCSQVPSEQLCFTLCTDLRTPAASGFENLIFLKSRIKWKIGVNLNLFFKKSKPGVW